MAGFIKKFCLLFVCFIVLLAMTMPVTASDKTVRPTIVKSSIILNLSKNALHAEETVELTVKLAAKYKMESLNFRIGYDSEIFEFVSGEWLIEGMKNPFYSQKSQNPTAEGYKSYVSAFIRFNGDTMVGSEDVFKIVFRAKENMPVRYTTFKITGNGEYDLWDALNDDKTANPILYNYDTTSPTITINPHVYEEWESYYSAEYHTRVCKECKKNQKEAHIFGEWTVTCQPTKDTEGEKVRFCSVCGYRSAQFIAMLPTDTEIIEDSTDSLATEPLRTNTPEQTESTDQATGLETTVEPTVQTEQDKFPIIWYVLGGIVLCVLAGGVILFVVSKKKK